MKDSQFAGQAPLSTGEETTAHEAPGYYWIYSVTASYWGNETLMCWIQAALGTLTVLCYFFFARWALGKSPVALVAGLLTALHPFWILNTAEMNDGVLASFGLSLVLMLGQWEAKRAACSPARSSDWPWRGWFWCVRRCCRSLWSG